jgi:hypothetical protein
MAQNFSSAHLAVIDERIKKESVTMGKFGNNIRLDFNGRNSVTIYNVDTVAENDYVRSGSNRYGSLVELGTGTQTLTLSQDKSFTFTVDKGNYEDSMMVTEVTKAIKRQAKEVAVPAVDTYNLGVLSAYALAQSTVQGIHDGTGVAYNTIYQLILAQQSALSEAEYPTEGRTLWITPTNYNLLKRDPEFVRDCDTSVKDLKRGIMGEVDGLTIVQVPSSRMQDDVEFMITCEGVGVAINKFEEVKTHSNPPGVNGWLVEGRRYHDFFVLGEKGTGIRVYEKA